MDKTTHILLYEYSIQSRYDNVIADLLRMLSLGSISYVKEGRNDWPMKFTNMCIFISVCYILLKTKWS